MVVYSSDRGREGEGEKGKKKRMERRKDRGWRRRKRWEVGHTL